MTVTLAICTRNREELAKRLLSDVNKLTEPPNEVLFVECSIENTFFSQKKIETSIHTWPQGQVSFRYMKGKWKNIASSRNVALKNAKSDIVLFVDDDVRIQPDLVTLTKKLHKEYPNVTGIVGKTLSIDHDIFSEFSQSYCFYAMHLKRKRTIIQASPFFCISMKKKVLTKQDMRFNEKLDTGEDLDFQLKLHDLGETFLFCPEILNHHDFLRGSYLTFFRRFMGYLYARPLLYQMHKEKHAMFFYDIEELLPRKKAELFLLPFFLCFKVIKLSLQQIKDLRLKPIHIIPSILFHLMCVQVYYFSEQFRFILKERINAVMKQTPSVVRIFHK
jgi:glycosyltransferase involved in cell wall biosynthesis